MNCQKADLLIQKSLDETLSATERTALDSHLAGCTACQSAWDEYRVLARSTTEWVDRASVSAMSDDAFAQQLLGQITARAPKTTMPRGAIGRWVLAGSALIGGSIAASVFTGPRISPQISLPASAISPVSAVQELPNWLLRNMHEIGASITSTSWNVLRDIPVPAWTFDLFLGALVVNGLFFWRAITSNRRQTTS
jgi:anti-sigma factor RsiW